MWMRNSIVERKKGEKSEKGKFEFEIKEVFNDYENKEAPKGKEGHVKREVIVIYAQRRRHRERMKADM